MRGIKYSSKIIKARALLPDTKLLLENWDEDADVPANLDRIRQENIFGKHCGRDWSLVLRVDAVGKTLAPSGPYARKGVASWP